METPQKPFHTVRRFLSFGQCKDQKWVKELPGAKEILREVYDYGICIADESLDIYITSKSDSDVSIAFFPCSVDNKVTCKNNIDITAVEFQIWQTEKTINIKKFDNPISLMNKYTYSFRRGIFMGTGWRDRAWEKKEEIKLRIPFPKSMTSFCKSTQII